MSQNVYVPAVEVTRGQTVESIHFAAAAVVDRHGRLIAHLGSADLVTFSRSSLKPFQALSTVLRGFPGRFGLEDRHLAVMCASHSGEERHVQAVREILNAIDADESDLQCGSHVPLIYAREDQTIPPKSSFSPIYNNCSGKHAGMLALAKILGSSKGDYLDTQSPVQQLIRARVTGMLDVQIRESAVGIDGCSAPNYAVPLRALAYGFARIAASAGPMPHTDEECSDACTHIVKAMQAHPEMVSGTGRFDLALSQATGSRIFSKAGGEAVECVGIPERGWGIAVKVLDGSARAVGPVVVSVLQQLEILKPHELEALENFVHPVVTNHRGIHVGTIRVVGKLIRE